MDFRYPIDPLAFGGVALQVVGDEWIAGKFGDALVRAPKSWTWFVRHSVCIIADCTRAAPGGRPPGNRNSTRQLVSSARGVNRGR